MDLKANIPEALTFLSQFRAGPINLVTIDPVTNYVEGKTFKEWNALDLTLWLDHHVHSQNIYFSVNEPYIDAPDNKLKKEHIARIHYFFADFDPQGPDFEKARQELLFKADLDIEGPLAPTYIIDSGGGVQYFWQFVKPLDAFGPNDHLEAVNKALANKFGKADAVQNIDRIMRLPGTINHPTQKKKNRGRKPAVAKIIAYTGNTYRLSDFPEPAEPGIPVSQNTIKTDLDLDMDIVRSVTAVADLDWHLFEKFHKALKEDEALKDRWTGGVDGLTDISRSGRDMSLTAMLKRHNFTLQECGQLLWLFPYGKNVELTKREIIRCYGRSSVKTTEEVFQSAEPVEQVMAQIAEHSVTQAKVADQKPKLYWKKFKDAEPDLDKISLIEDYLDQGAMSVLYGESNTGKTFVALDMAYHIAANRTWFGKKVEQGAVVYVAAEGGRLVENRIKALKLFYKDLPADIPFAIVPCPIDLLGDKSDTKPLIDLIRDVEAQFGVPVKFIVIDTLSRALAGGNENAPDDMGALVKNLDRIRVACQSHLMVVHHSGKDTAKGARGHSLLRAATDTEIEIHNKQITTRKQRDMAFGKSINFDLEKVVIGENAGGFVISCVVVGRVEGEKVPLNPDERRLFDCLVGLAEKSGEKGVDGKAWFYHFYETYKEEISEDTLARWRGQLEEKQWVDVSGANRWKRWKPK